MHTKHVIDYAAAGSLFSVAIPAGTPVTEATNLPPADDGSPQYWADAWPGISEEAASWQRTYGFLIDASEVSA